MNFVDRWRAFMLLSVEKRLKKIMNFVGVVLWLICFVHFFFAWKTALVYLILSIVFLITDSETVLRKVGYYEKKKY